MCGQNLRCLKSKYPSSFSARRVFRHAGTDVRYNVIDFFFGTEVMFVGRGAAGQGARFEPIVGSGAEFLRREFGISEGPLAMRRRRSSRSPTAYIHILLLYYFTHVDFLENV